MKTIRISGVGLAMTLLLALVAAVAVGCASDDGVSEEQMRSIVSEAVAESMPEPQEQLSAEDIQSMVESTMMDMMGDREDLTAAEVQSMVESAVMQAAEQGATAEEIEALVRNAVDEATSEAMGGLDISSEVSQAVAANSLTQDEIEAIVAKAFEEQSMMADDAAKETIVFSDLNWTSAQVQNRIAQYIVEHGYGYPTDVVLGATLPNFQGLQKGDIHVTLEIWLPNQSIGWEKAIEIGDVVSVGKSLVGDWQSTFVIPKYIADENPDLKTPQDLMKPEYQELFATADSRGKARLVACVIGWSCELVNTAQIEAYDLVDHLHVINPGSQEAMFAEVYGAFQKEEPWLGYMWGTGDPGLKLDLVRLEEPPYTQECWDTTKACAFAESLVLVAVHKSLLPRAPDVIAMLQNWEVSIDTYKAIFQWMDANPGSEASDGAKWFLMNNNIWETWVTPEAAARVNAKLAEAG